MIVGHGLALLGQFLSTLCGRFFGDWLIIRMALLMGAQYANVCTQWRLALGANGLRLTTLATDGCVHRGEECAKSVPVR